MIQLEHSLTFQLHQTICNLYSSTTRIPRSHLFQSKLQFSNSFSLLFLRQRNQMSENSQKYHIARTPPAIHYSSPNKLCVIDVIYSNNRVPMATTASLHLFKLNMLGNPALLPGILYKFHRNENLLSMISLGLLILLLIQSRHDNLTMRVIWDLFREHLKEKETLIFGVIVLIRSKRLLWRKIMLVQQL